MKNSFKALAGAALLMAISAPAAQAQQEQPQGSGQRGGMRGGRMMEALLKGITLDSAQKAQIEVIKGKYEKEMPAFTPGQEPDSSARAQRREMMMKEQGDIRAVLNEEQQKTFDKNVEEMRDRMQKRGGGKH